MPCWLPRAAKTAAALPAALLATLAAALSLLGGCCQTESATFPDRTRADVWDAVVQACRDPRYPDWIVTANNVRVEDSAQEVFVFRELKRDLATTGLKPRREEASWRFTATVLPGRQPTVEFTSPDWAIPAHFWAQADHFFAQVRVRLTEMGPATPAPGDPMAGGALPAQKDPREPGRVDPVPTQGRLAEP